MPVLGLYKERIDQLFSGSKLDCQGFNDGLEDFESTKFI